ncbi:glycosyltransferase family 2 protein [Aeromonas veronii]|uniref:glycosyltransferase family 2 protein n=1 Tax=Aeromonas veronii TaxID=654 RepID=UPI003D1F8922
MANVHAIIVTYNPDVNVVASNLRQLLGDKSISRIHIVDNTPDGANFEKYKSDNVEVKYFYKNIGIAAAQNFGMKVAVDSGADYIVLFDQDSALSSDLVSGLVNAMSVAKKNKLRLACIGPRPLDVFTGEKYKPRIQEELKSENGITICRQIIASGKLIDVDALKVVGFMEDGLFIDVVDHEWCWRAYKKGFSVAIAEDVIMPHTLGDSRGSLLGFKYRIGAPVRLYYQFRNILVLLRRDYVPLYWKIRSIFSISVRFIVFGFIQRDSNERMKYMLKGFRDGIAKRMGEYKS